MSKLFKNYHVENNLATANKDSKSHTPLVLLQKFPKGILTSILYVKLYHSENVLERWLKNIKHLCSCRGLGSVSRTFTLVPSFNSSSRGSNVLF